MLGHKIHGQIWFGSGIIIWHYFVPLFNYGSKSLAVNLNYDYEDYVSVSEIKDI